MKFAPIGIGAAMAVTVSHSGIAVLKNLGLLVATLYGALIVFALVALLPVAYLTGIPIRRFIRQVKDPAIIAFTTTSSDAALPLAMERMIEFGIPRRIVAFVMPTGYSFNLDGSTLYLGVASMFVAQAAGVDPCSSPARESRRCPGPRSWCSPASLRRMVYRSRESP
jgi:proton glutamate symport protein